MLIAAGATAGIVEAASHGDRDKVALFLNSGTPVDDSNDQGLTPLMAAAARGDINLVAYLLRHGADLARVDGEGNTAFHHAVRHASRTNETSLLHLMLDSGADVNAAGSRGAVPAQNALYPESCGVLEFLLDHGANASRDASSSGTTLLIQAIHLDYCELRTVELLIDYGADIDAADERGFTPLVHAVRLKPERDDVRFQRAAARIRNIPYVKREPRHRLALVKLLVERGADVNAASDRGSVLSHAVESWDVDLVRFLLDAGAGADAVGVTLPIRRADVSGSREVEALLRERGVPCIEVVVDPIVREALSRPLVEVSGPATFKGFLVDRINEALRRKKNRT